MKKFTTMVITVLIIVFVCNVSWAEEYAAEELHMYDNSPGFIWNNAILVPANEVFEFLNMDYNYNKSNGIVSVNNPDAYKRIAMQINNKFAMLGISDVYLSVPPVIYNNILYIPCERLMKWMDGTAEFDTDCIYLSMPTAEGTIKSAAFPAMEVDTSKLTRIPQVNLVEPVTAGDTPITNGDFDLTIRLNIAAGTYPTIDDWAVLYKKAYTILNNIQSDSDIAMTLAIQKSGKSFLHIFIPLTTFLASGDPKDNPYFYELKTYGIANYLRNIADTACLIYKDKLQPGLWEKYNSCIKVSMVNSLGNQFTVEVPLKFSEINGYAWCSLDKAYKTYINNSPLKISTSQYMVTGKCDKRMVEFFKHPVTKPLQPYFDMVNYKYNKSLTLTIVDKGD